MEDLSGVHIKKSDELSYALYSNSTREKVFASTSQAIHDSKVSQWTKMLLSSWVFQ